jgi:hypothetical protein
MANFKVGDEVVLLSTIPNIPNRSGGQNNHKRYAQYVKAGDRFTVHAMNSFCTAVRELPASVEITRPCMTCGTLDFNTYWHINNWRLVKLDGLNEPLEEVVGTDKTVTLAQEA